MSQAVTSGWSWDTDVMLPAVLVVAAAAVTVSSMLSIGASSKF